MTTSPYIISCRYKCRLAIVHFDNYFGVFYFISASANSSPVKSRRLPRFLDEAERDGRPYLVAYAAKVRAGDVERP